MTTALLPRLREWQSTRRGRWYVTRLGDVCIVARTVGSPLKGEGRGTWTLARVSATTGEGISTLVSAVHSVNGDVGRIVSSAFDAARAEGNGVFVLTIPPRGREVLRQRDAWKAYMAQGRPQWRTREEAQAWVSQFMVAR